MKIFVLILINFHLNNFDCSIFNKNPCGTLKIDPMPDFNFTKVFV